MNKFLFVAVGSFIFAQYAFATNINPVTRQQVSCSTDKECNVGFIFPFLVCNNGTCEAPPALPEFRINGVLVVDQPAGGPCVSFRNCLLGLVCVSGNPRGTCEAPKGVLGLSHLIVNLIQEDYTPGTEANPAPDTEPRPTQGTPLLTSRAVAIIYLAVHDTYGILTGEFKPKISSQLFKRSKISTMKSYSSNSRTSASQIEGAAIIAGLTAAKILYPESVERINSVQDSLAGQVTPSFATFGMNIAKAWIAVRSNDGSGRRLTDDIFALDVFLRHQPDPNFPLVREGAGTQDNLGRFWGLVRPFVLSNVRKQAFLARNPGPNTDEYRENFDEVMKKGECNNITQDGVPIEDIGLFWGYDGAPLIGVPPRLYLQVVLAVKELETLSFKEQIRAFSAVGASMADAGIAAWLWKFEYDLWRPVVGIRRDRISPDPKWDPRGVGLTNVVTLASPPSDRPPVCVGINPNFPAYPSGHASFGTAAFTVLAKLLGKRPSDITVTFTSDEFNGVSIEGTSGTRRREFTQTFTLQEGIQQNLDSRVFIGVHWRFDSDGGEIVGDQVADIVAKEFAF